MWFNITIVVCCVLIWKLLTKAFSSLEFYRQIFKCLSQFPSPVENHWFYGIAHVVRDSEEYLQTLQNTVEKFQPKAVALWITWLRPTLAVVHPDTVKIVLKASHMTAPKSREYRFFRSWLGDGLIVSCGKKRERNRRLVTPAFHFDVLKPYVQVCNDVSELFLSRVASQTANGKSTDVCPFVKRATLDTMLRCVLSYVDEGIQNMDNGEHPYCLNIHKVRDIITRRWTNPLYHNDFLFRLTTDSKELKKCCNYLHDFSNSLIRLRRKFLENELSQLKKRHLDFLDILLTARDENDAGLSDQEIRDEVDTFMFGGHDSTASAIMWSLFALAKYPRMQQKVRNEVNDVLGGRTSLEYNDLQNLRFTTCFIKESLRMYTPVPGVNRRLAEPLIIEGVTFPVDTVIDIVPDCVHHNPVVWENHNEFNPDRFLPENFAKKDPFSFLPFSAGPRNCIGQHFAMDEIKVFVSQTARRFEITMDDTKPAVMFRDLIATAKTGIYLCFKEL